MTNGNGTTTGAQTTEPAFSGQRPSFTALPNWLRGKASAHEIAILWVLQSHWPEIRPSLPRIANETGLSRSTVLRALAGMERKGWLLHARRFLEQGGQVANLYELRVWDGEPGSQAPSGKTLFQKGDQAQANPCMPPGVTQTPPRVRETPPRVRETHPPCQGDTPPVSQGHPPRVTQTPEVDRTKEERTKEEQHEEELEAATLSRCSPAPVAPPTHTGRSGDQDACQNEPEAPMVPASASERKRKAPRTKPMDGPVALPAFAEPYRDHLASWWRLRCKTHPKLDRSGLGIRSVEALTYAYGLDVLRQFCEIASGKGWESLGFNGYRGYLQKLAADEQATALAPSSQPSAGFGQASNFVRFPTAAERNRIEMEQLARELAEQEPEFAPENNPDRRWHRSAPNFDAMPSAA